MEKEILEYNGFFAQIIYQPFFDDSKPPSKRYKLIIKKDDKEFVNRYGLTRSGAITHFHRWVDKNCH